MAWRRKQGSRALDFLAEELHCNVTGTSRLGGGYNSKAYCNPFVDTLRQEVIFFTRMARLDVVQLSNLDPQANPTPVSFSCGWIFHKDAAWFSRRVVSRT
jgi:hypothetical protein